jgi:hypothetical protein
LIKYLLHDHSKAYKAVEVQIYLCPAARAFVRKTRTVIGYCVETHFEWARCFEFHVEFYIPQCNILRPSLLDTLTFVMTE